MQLEAPNAVDFFPKNFLVIPFRCLFIFPGIASSHPEVLLVHISVYVCFFSIVVVKVSDVSKDNAGGVHVNVEMAPLTPGTVTGQANLSAPSRLL